MLDEERHHRLEHEARRTGQSLAALIREAIDMRLDLGGVAKRRREAAARLLAMPRPPGLEQEQLELEEELLDSGREVA
jgi:hypothetical protein